MTLDEAREVLGVNRGATVAEIRDAFRRRAREVHPDRHPMESEARRRQLGRDFDRAREAQDILVKFSSNSGGAAGSAATGTTTRSGGTTHVQSTPSGAGARSQTSTAPPPPRERARPRTSESRPRAEAPRVTIRFQEFVTASDAEGFGPGKRTRRWIDWPRIIAWSGVGVLAALIVSGSYVAAYVL